MASRKTVTVTGAAGNIGYSIVPQIASGLVFGPDTPVRLQLLEIPPAMGALQGVAMELDDCAFPLLQGVEITDDPKNAFEGSDLCLLVGSKPRGAGMERKDLIRENGPIFEGQGQAIQERASGDVRIVVVGNPCNTNCLIAMHSAPDVPRDRWSAMTQLDHNRAQAMLADKLGVDSSQVANVVIWGNHSNTQYPDWHHAMVGWNSASGLLTDEVWLKETFIPAVQKRGAAIIKARGASSAMSAATAAVEHSRKLYRGTPAGRWTSMAVISEGAYGVPKGLICSVPVTCPGDGTYTVVKGLEFNDFGKEKFKISIAELEEERATVSDLL